MKAMLPLCYTLVSQSAVTHHEIWFDHPLQKLYICYEANALQFLYASKLFYHFKSGYILTLQYWENAYIAFYLALYTLKHIPI